jgi:hypothetical protein
MTPQRIAHRPRRLGVDRTDTCGLSAIDTEISGFISHDSAPGRVQFGLGRISKDRDILHFARTDICYPASLITLPSI